MKRTFLVVVLLVCALSPVVRSEKNSKSDIDRKSILCRSMPDYCQLDSRLPKRGTQYCGPTAVSNALVWLAMNGHPDLVPFEKNDSELAQFNVIQKLGSDEYMKTARYAGTDPLDVLTGLDKYIRDQGFEPIIEWQGYREGGRYALAEVPQLTWIADKFIDGDFNVILEVGWYNFCDGCKSYKRKGGHYVTLAGLDLTSENPIMVIHNPSVGGGKEPLPQTCKLQRITYGDFAPWGNYRKRPAAGYWTMDGITMPDNAQIAILEGAVKFSVADKKIVKTKSNNYQYLLAEF
ncbi:MAG: hypothetical protein GX629_11720 [Phycisphaerae bacterium]|nr:hypothetical protein [Phycisphaerae bacterium]